MEEEKEIELIDYIKRLGLPILVIDFYRPSRYGGTPSADRS